MRAGEGVRTAIVTGSEGGLGVALCAAFRAAGDRVVGVDLKRRDSACDAFVELDLAALAAGPEAQAAAAEALRRAVGDQPLATLVNNAATQRLGRLDDLTHDAWRSTLAVNLTAPLFLIQSLAPDLERAGGTVINVGSVHSRASKPGFLAYATSKAVLAGMTRALALDLAPGIRVNAVNPAAIDTPMLRAGLHERSLAALHEHHPAGRIAQPEEIARLVVFLASGDAAFMTGSTIDVDGGVLSRLHDPE